MRDMRNVTMTRLRGFIGAAAAVLVVGLIALLLTHNAATRSKGTGANADATPPATPHPNATPQPQNNTAYLQPDQLPVVAQSDPSVVYKLASGALQRSSDGGATYSSEALPKTDLSSIDSTSVGVSPLDATHIFVTMAGKKGDQGCLPPSAPYPAIATHGGIMASGYVPCAEQYMSVDGGHTWTQPKLPFPAVLGGLNLFRAAHGPTGDQQYAFKAVGQRLYSAMAFSNMAGSLLDSPGARLVASDDGGLSWSLIDAGLATQSRFICDFGVAQSPSVIYAVTADQGCGSEGFPNLSLWRSADGGQSWTRVRSLPTLAETGVFIGAQGQLYLYMPQVTVQGHGANMTSAPADVYVSLDGGATFSSAPAAGLPAQPTMVGPYATLADGSLICGAASSLSSAPGPQALYTWKQGQSSWTKIADGVAQGIASVTAIAPAAGATQQTIIITDNAGNIATVKVTLGQ
jgi:hypothetical protein